VLPAYLVRLAGFAFDRLAPLRCVRAADAEATLDAAATARRAIGHALDTALSQERYADHPAFDDPAVRKALSRHVKRARAFARQLSDAAPPARSTGPSLAMPPTTPPTTPPAMPPAMPIDSLAEVVRVVPRVATLVAELHQAHARWQDAGAAFVQAFTDDLEQTRAAIRALYGDDERLQEAVFLESPEAYDRVAQLIATAGPRNVRARQRERLAAMYAQRFCAKNDTNSICGPHGVAYTHAGEAAAAAQIEITVEDARRQTYFSHWAAQRLLDTAVQRARHAPITHRLHPTAVVDDDAVAWCVMDHDATSTFRRRYARSSLPPGGARLLRAMAQPRTLAELAGLAAELELGVDDLAAFVEELAVAGIVLRGPLLPPGLFHPLRGVAAELEAWPAGDAKTWALAEVGALEDLVAAFARAPLSGRLEVFPQLAARFEAATGDAAQRGEGRHYADRSVLHEDCYAEVRADLGPARAALDHTLPTLITALELPLELTRERVRSWFRARFGAGVRVGALEVHRAFDDDRVLETAAASTPRAAALATAIEAVRDAIARAVAGSHGGPVRVASGALADALAGLAAPSHAGYVSVDLMLRQLPAGAIELVLGEVHAFFWLPTCLLDVLPPDHCARVLDQMRGAVRAMAHGKPTAECLLLHTQATDRRFPLATTDLQMLVPGDRADAIDFAALELSLVGDELVFWRGDEEIVPLVAYSQYPFLLYTSRIAPLFDDYLDRFFPDSLLPEALRTEDAPRLTVDGIVVRRRMWRRPVAAVRAALAAPTEAELFRRAQAFQRALGCDACVFVSLSGEPKPILLDFHNLFLLEALVNLLERQPDDASVKLSEMLPGPDELVARGPDGLRTSELRMGFYRT
jgi:hypothetical protein